MPDEYVTRKECEIHTKSINRRIDEFHNDVKEVKNNVINIRDNHLFHIQEKMNEIEKSINDYKWMFIMMVILTGLSLGYKVIQTVLGWLL